MPQITITISEDLHSLLNKVRTQQARPLSEMAAMILELGLYDYMQRRNTAEVYLKLERRRKNELGEDD
mgnify:CR=1 FL=1